MMWSLLVRRLVGVLTAFCFLCFSVVACAASHETSRGSRRLEVDLEKYSVKWDEFPEVQFSTNGSSLCVWWQLGADLDPPRFLIFDLAGKWVAGNGTTNYDEALNQFPELVWRWKVGDFATIHERPERGVIGVAFNRDLTRGARTTVLAGGGLDYQLEAWRLSEPRERLWKRGFDTEGEMYANRPRPLSVLGDWITEPLLIKLNTERCLELDPRTGGIRRTFTFGPIESEKEAELRLKKFGGREDDFSSFSAGSIEYEPKRGWLACGCSHDQRARVISLSATEKIIFEVNAEKNPFRPWGGSWSTTVSFLAGGDYLLVECEYSRRFGPFKLEREIYETASWRLVWKGDDYRMTSLTLSPDGKTMAYTRKATMVICPFLPKPLDAKKPVR
jgi:hypothetical protein